MTKKELEKEATEWVIKNSGYSKNEFHGRKAIETYIASAEPREKRIAELEAQLENDRDLPTIAYMQGAEKQKKKDAEQLTKAKEIIKKFSEFANLEVEYDPEHPQKHTDLWNELCKEAEQFISEEVEK